MTERGSNGGKVIWGIVFLLAVLHWDFWWWDNGDLVLGFLPVGLFYHTVFSLVAAAVWLAALKFCWPHELEAWAEDGSVDEGGEDAS